MITLKLNMGGGEADITLKETDRLYDCGVEFNLELSEDDIKKLLIKNPSIAIECLHYGDDTVVGDNFFLALVEDITGQSWDRIKAHYKDQAYEYVELVGVQKGYQRLKD